MKQLVLAMSLLFVSLTAFSGDYSINVCKVQAHTSEIAYLYPCDESGNSNWESKNNCNSDTWVSWDMEAGQGQAMYSTALAAMLSDKTITVRVSGVSDDCNGSYDSTSMVRINK